MQAKWAIIWTVWVLALIASFGFLEGWAIDTAGNTLSASVWHLTRAWPPFAMLFGMVFGGLGVHFFWTNQGLKK